jgi:hypothetical protein
MIETIASRLRKLEGRQGPATEEIKFRVFGVKAVGDGTYRRVNLASGNVKVMKAEQLGIEPYQAKDISKTIPARKDAFQDGVSVPERVVSEQESKEAEQARHIQDVQIWIDRNFSDEGCIRITDRYGTRYP